MIDLTGAHALDSSEEGDDLSTWRLQPLQARITGRHGRRVCEAVEQINLSLSGDHPEPPACAAAPSACPPCAPPPTERGALQPVQLPGALPPSTGACGGDACSSPGTAPSSPDYSPTNRRQRCSGGKRSSGGARRGGDTGVSVAASKRRGSTVAEHASKKAVEKAAREAARAEAKAARQAAADAARTAKRFAAFAARKANGGCQALEVVVQLDAATAASPLGSTLVSELDRRRTGCWQVVPTLPLSGRWPGCAVFEFKRRMLSEAEEQAAKIGETTQLQHFAEDAAAAPRYLSLVFQQPKVLLSQLRADGLASLLSAVRCAAPGCTLGLLLLGVRGALAAGGAAAAGWEAREADAALLRLTLTTPGLQLRLLEGAEDAALHLAHTVRAIAQQPYFAGGELDAVSGPGAASRATALAMGDDLGPAARAFAVNTLGRMAGMGVTKAWAIAREYPSLGALMQGYQAAADSAAATAASAAPVLMRRHAAMHGAELLLADLIEATKGTDAARPRRVGPAMSRRLHLLLTCEDPDVILEGCGEGEGGNTPGFT